LACLIVACAAVARRGWAPASESQADGRMGALERARWLALAFAPSSLLLGVTTFLTTDLAPMPLLWVIPLIIYLLSFIVAFANPPSWVRRGSALARPPALLATVAPLVARSV